MMTDVVWREFWRAYARMMGIEDRRRMKISEVHSRRVGFSGTWSTEADDLLDSREVLSSGIEAMFEV
jgi:hypothetical protein